jgi:hypothetical protein
MHASPEAIMVDEVNCLGRRRQSCLSLLGDAYVLEWIRRRRLRCGPCPEPRGKCERQGLMERSWLPMHDVVYDAGVGDVKLEGVRSDMSGSTQCYCNVDQVNMSGSMTRSFKALSRMPVSCVQFDMSYGL